MGMLASVLFIEGNYLSVIDRIIEMFDYANVKTVGESSDFFMAEDVVEKLELKAPFNQHFFTAGLYNGWTIISNFGAMRDWYKDDCGRLHSVVNSRVLSVYWYSGIGNYYLSLFEKGNLARALEIKSGILEANLGPPLPGEPGDTSNIGEGEIHEMIKGIVGFGLEELLWGRNGPGVESVTIKSADDRLM